MRHLLICREYPPAPSGGIGTYATWISRLLAEAGETVHVIGQMWNGAEAAREELCDGKLIVHRVPFENWNARFRGRPHPAVANGALRKLFDAGIQAQCFSWQAGLLAERLVADESIQIIEAQEYEAPLYYFQLRRALGLGPRSHPPCVVHLHSPTALIAQHNEWSADALKVRTAIRLENYSIAAADALLCPSHYLAGQVATRHALPANAVAVIPYPVGRSEILERGRETWNSGTICYVGRLEHRKGVLEWIAAAVAIARGDPAFKFEFIGRNALGVNRISGDDMLRRLIPAAVQAQFNFRGEQSHAALGSFLRKARIAVVPSRWENFPYSCIEAMASGLPVIATREGGMAEMIEDDRSGWLAAEATSAGLGDALQRALGVSGAALRDMGREAARRIVDVCGNGRIITAQMEFRRRVVDTRPRDHALPEGLSLSHTTVSDSIESFVRLENERSGVLPISPEFRDSAAYALRHPVKTVNWLLRQRLHKRTDK